MSHVVRRPSWAEIDLDTDAGRVFCQERWLYHWWAVPPASPWTLRERRRFHNTMDRQVWSRWSGHRLRVTGDHEFARRVGPRGVEVSFDVRWVLVRPHWRVDVRKLPPGSDPTTFISNVDFGARRIELDSADLASYRAGNAAGQHRDFFALPHEFGHTMDNPDEYVAGSPALADTDSILNVGARVRRRHVHLLSRELEAMMPGCTFTAEDA